MRLPLGFVSTSTGSTGAGSAAGSFDGSDTTSADVAVGFSTAGSAVSDFTSSGAAFLSFRISLNLEARLVG